jgi:hypothetical protein
MFRKRGVIGHLALELSALTSDTFCFGRGRRRFSALSIRDVLSSRVIFALYSADGGTNRDSRLIFGNRLGQNQLSTQPKSSGQTGAAIHNGNRDRSPGTLPIAAHVENELGGGKVLAINEHEIEAIGIELLRGRGAIERALAGDGHFFEYRCDIADGLIIGR